MNFDLLGWSFKKSEKQQEVQNADPFIQKTDDDGAFIVNSGYSGHSSYHMSADTQFDSEIDLIKKYREISLHPEVDSAINEIVNESINGEEDTQPVSIVLDQLELSDNIKEKIKTEFDYICKLLNLNNESYELFRKFYVDGRLYHYIVIDTNKSQNGIQELRYIPSVHIKKMREDKTSIGPGGIEQTDSYKEYFMYSKKWNTASARSSAITLSKDSICYVHSGLNMEDNNLIYGWLHKAIKPANQLRMMEDALIVYRLSRAPERRIFYIDVGQLPKSKAEEYIKGLQNRFKNKLVYDVVTGEVKDSRNTLSMMEDFWLPRGMNGKGTEVTTLPGGQTLGQIDDVEFFKKKLYMSLNVPIGRITSDQGSAMFSVGRSDSISRDEVKFSRFISRLRKRFSKLFLQLLKTQLVLKRVMTPDDWDVLEEKIRFDFQQDTFFAELKDAEILKERLTTLQMAEPYIGRFFSQAYIRKNILKQTEDEIEEMMKEIGSEDPYISPANELEMHMNDVAPPEDNQN